MNKEKVKKYLKENKEEILKCAAIGAIAGAGALLGWKTCEMVNGLRSGRHVIIGDAMNQWMDNACLDHKIKTYRPMVFLNNAKIGAEELGKLSLYVKALGCPSDVKFDHFLLVGNEVK